MLKKGYFDAVFKPGGVIPTKKVMGALRDALVVFVTEEYGYKESTFKNRLFRLGFDAWQLMGVDRIKDEYAREHPELAEWRSSDKSFFELMTDLHLPKMQFYAYLRGLGMMSHKVASRRFTNEDWARWEREGVKAMLTQFCNEQ